MLVSIGSKNKVKIEAVREAIMRIGLNAEVISVEVSPEVPLQPFGHQTFIGARNRAFKSLKETDSDIGIGIEGGVFSYENRLMAFAVVYAVDRNGLENFSFSTSFTLPTSITSLIFQGKELGEATDIVFSAKGSKENEGAIGYLTKVINRKELYVQPVIAALYPFYNNVD
ncbi:DUF84 family protein [Sulfolobus acidocaldarius]|uniref:Probable inosine/xanthosine triphosphatase n=4 Tax=Sulfolobus acidocaldarius TaxID=2285 RepID=Q4JCL0_SULAC|nr:inosine/xanthosine triphosphatase [Sulfolobus acidocaldarius]AAY79469.1 conserved protein [Sulfolobus acidocaldarius DSM 639]AGE70018.1 hypothetical protein SacN8_00185 [Sulfolobus acidocaldarius N8]AGE72293.1 hypothetical protein SacRon12I_00185 [Sulfolobus acidocaldarius Ron12/I]ALU29555.1 purine NTP phosphatase [Sulfolobus acidocaldarius]ALU32285.1 purine NTP phosphatase [Sulfolobus acidocaldarius]